MKKFSFDKNYYDRFYRDRATRVATRSGIRALGRFVSSYLKHLGMPVERVLDLGCGLGYWKDVIAKEFRNADYVGVEVSEYLCEELGWEKGSAVDYQADEPFDLVICQGVMQYLSASDARAAIRNLTRLCRGALYLEILTKRDWEECCEQEVTDGNTFLREGSWYRRQLDRSFRNLGGGVFLARSAPVTLFELERADST